MFPKIVGFPSKSSILIGFSIIFTIHFGVPLFLETPIRIHMKMIMIILMLYAKDTSTYYFILLLFAPSPDSSNFRCSKYYHENLPEAMTYVGLMLVPYSSNNLPPVPRIFPVSKALISSKRCFHGRFGMDYFHRLHSMTPQESWFR